MKTASMSASMSAFGSAFGSALRIHLAKLGPAARDVGSGLYVLEWDVTDGRVFSVSAASCGKPYNVGFRERAANKPAQPLVEQTHPPMATLFPRPHTPMQQPDAAAVQHDR